MPAMAVPVLSLKFAAQGTRPGKVDDSIKRGYEQSMPLTTTRKQELINTHQTHGTDTGSNPLLIENWYFAVWSYMKSCRSSFSRL